MKVLRKEMLLISDRKPLQAHDNGQRFRSG